MKLFKHLSQQPFIVATGFAALVHSTWSLGTFFSGEQPHEPLPFILWLIPALLISFSLDIGQIVTSAEIRAGQRSRAKYLTFGVFAGATYFLQFTYCVSHMPAIALAAGVRADWSNVITFIRDSAVFIIPALLPMSTLLYTFSQRHEAAPPAQPESATPSTALALVPDPAAQQIVTLEPPKIEVECDEPGCTWAGVYDTPVGARNALTSHRRTHKVMVGTNGNGSHE